MKYLFFFLLGLLTFNQNDSLVDQNRQNNFPDDFVGEWIGELKIYQVNKLVQTVEMELIIQPLDSNRYTWNIIYGEDKVAGLRAYELVTLNKEVGHFEIDEKNSIVLDGYVLGGIFYQQFEVMGSNLLVSVEKRKNILIFQIIVSKYDSIRTTGGETINDDKMPAVQSFEMMARQIAELRKKE